MIDNSETWRVAPTARVALVAPELCPRLAVPLAFESWWLLPSEKSDEMRLALPLVFMVL